MQREARNRHRRPARHRRAAARREQRARPGEALPRRRDPRRSPERPEPVRCYDQSGAAFAAARADFRREASWILGQPYQDREPNAIRTEFATACEKHVELIRDAVKRERARKDLREALSPKRFGPKAAEKAFVKLIGGWRA